MASSKMGKAEVVAGLGSRKGLDADMFGVQSLKDPSLQCSAGSCIYKNGIQDRGLTWAYKCKSH